MTRRNNSSRIIEFLKTVAQIPILIMVVLMVILLSLIFYVTVSIVEDIGFIKDNEQYCKDLHGDEYVMLPVIGNDIAETTIGYVCCKKNEYVNNKGEWFSEKECEEETWIKKEQ